MKEKPDLTVVKGIEEPDMSECPYCGNDEYYIKLRYSGKGICRYRFDGEEADNEDLYDNVGDTLIGKFAYCAGCDKKIFRVKE